MRNTLLCAAFLAVGLLLVAPAASAVTFMPPPPPTATCNPWPPGSGGGIEEILNNILNEATTFGCNRVHDANTVAGIGYTFVMGEVAIVVGIVSPAVDGTQDNYCTAMYGEPNPPGHAECQDIVVRVDPVTA
ncbi:MAG: hypothetical protein QOD77_1951 [Thermoplasmata archaeon]|jgi:hypothetical protein|nr:hypothetical protein [Thermoplasmata archaeon]